MPSSLPTHLSELQRTAGNRAVSSLVGEPLQGHGRQPGPVIQRQRVQTLSGRMVGDVTGADANLREDVLRVQDNLHVLWSLPSIAYAVEYAAVGALPARAPVPTALIPQTIAALVSNEQPILAAAVAQAQLGAALSGPVGLGQPNVKSDIVQLQNALHAAWCLTDADWAREFSRALLGPTPVNIADIPATIAGITQFKKAFAGGTSRRGGPMGTTSIPTPTAVGARDDALVTPGTATAPVTVGGVTRNVPLGFRDVVTVAGHPRHYREDLRLGIESVLAWMYPQSNALLSRPRIGGGAPGDMTSFEPIGAAAKQLVDTTVGTFGQFGPRFHSGVNLMDASNRATDPADLLRYLLNNQSELGVVRARHNAVHAPGRPETVIAENFMTAYLAVANNAHRLKVVDQAWPALNQGGVVSIQPFQGSTPNATRRIRWAAFQTMIHEYFHSLNHPNYYRYANRLGEDDASVLVEGGASLLTDYVWNASYPGHVASNPALIHSVEGSPVPFDPTVVPPINDAHYHPQIEQARDIETAFGGDNFRVAFLSGRMDLIGYARTLPGAGAPTGSQRYEVPPTGVRTLADVAYQTQTPLADLARMNALPATSNVSPGQVLKVQGEP